MFGRSRYDKELRQYINGSEIPQVLVVGSSWYGKELRYCIAIQRLQTLSETELILFLFATSHGYLQAFGGFYGVNSEYRSGCLPVPSLPLALKGKDTHYLSR